MNNVQRNILIVFLFFLVGLPFSYLIIELIWDYFGLNGFLIETIFFERSSCDPQEADPTFITTILLGLLPFVVTYSLAKIIKRIFSI